MHHAGQRGGRTEQLDLLRTQPPEVARTERNASRERGGTQPDTASRGAPGGLPSTPASAHTAARIHRNPGRRPVHTHREQQPRATRQCATRATAPSSTPIRDRVHTEQGDATPTAPGTHRDEPLKGTHRAYLPRNPAGQAASKRPATGTHRLSRDATRAERPARADRNQDACQHAPSVPAPKTRPQKRSATPGTKCRNPASKSARHRELRLSVPERRFRARSTRPDGPTR